MRVKDLIKTLKQYPNEALVYIDLPDGDTIRPITGIRYLPEFAPDQVYISSMYSHEHEKFKTPNSACSRPFGHQPEKRL